MKTFFLGIFLILIGASFVYYSGSLVRIFGRMQWAENYLGGTRQGYILLGMVFIILGFLMVFGVVDFDSGLRGF